MDDEAYFEKFRKFQEDLAAGKADLYKCPMPNGKQLGECTGEEVSKMADFFKEQQEDLREKMKELTDIIQFFSKPDTE